ncbi:YggT family protein [Bacillus alveayuensis]|jgi:YggT family protein|uniref:YggT family protein n=1 Tax=Aeribacillus alveayuensis TaxID=279215 RepID=UPI0005D0EF4C|nr:YggT family protein [Bacillus alveayuensis]
MNSLLSFLVLLIEIYSYALIVYILMSWFPNARDTRFGQLLANICEPYLEPFRRIIPPIGMLDVSPIVAILVLNFATRGLYALFDMLNLG